MSPIPGMLDPNASFRNLIYQGGRNVEVFSPEDYPETKDNEIPIRKKRRMRGEGVYDDPRLAMTLTEVDGVLRWHDGYGYRRSAGLRRSRMSPGVEGDIVAPINFQRLEPSKIGEYLKKARLQTDAGLQFRYSGTRHAPTDEWQMARSRGKASEGRPHPAFHSRHV